MKKIIGLIIFTFLLVSGFSQAAYNYQIRTVNAGVNNLDNWYFGNVTTSPSFVFVHDGVNHQPAGATFGTGIKLSSGQIMIDTSIFSTVALSGSYNDLIDLPPPPSARSFNNAPSHSIQTVAASANGFQVSSSRDASVSYSVTIITTATISGAASGYVVLEIASTNSSNAGDWIEVGRVSNGQSLSLALALQSVQTSGGSLSCIVPSGYYARLRSSNVSGTPTYTLNSGQEVLL